MVEPLRLFPPGTKAPAWVPSSSACRSGCRWRRCNLTRMYDPADASPAPDPAPCTHWVGGILVARGYISASAGKQLVNEVLRTILIVAPMGWAAWKANHSRSTIVRLVTRPGEQGAGAQ